MSSKPDWQVAIVDGQPVEMVNLPGVAELVKASPLGRREALARMRAMLPDDYYRQLEQLVEGQDRLAALQKSGLSRAPAPRRPRNPGGPRFCTTSASTTFSSPSTPAWRSRRCAVCGSTRTSPTDP